MLLRCRVLVFYAPILAPPPGSQMHPPPGTPTRTQPAHRRGRRRGHQCGRRRKHHCGRCHHVVRVAACEARNRGQPLLTARKPVSHHPKQGRHHVFERLFNLLFDNAWNLRHFFLELCLHLVRRAASAFLLSPSYSSPTILLNSLCRTHDQLTTAYSTYPFSLVCSTPYLKS